MIILPTMPKAAISFDGPRAGPGGSLPSWALSFQPEFAVPAKVSDELPEFYVYGHELYARKGRVEQPLRLRGVSWFGFEGRGAIVDGLFARPLRWFTAQFRQLGVNAIRVPLAVDNVILDPPPLTSAWQDPDAAKARSSLDVLRQLVRAAAVDGLLVLLDMHRLVAEIWPDPRGLWYSELVPEAALHAAWAVLAQSFCSEPNVLGADLLNEPWGAEWADWAAAAGRLATTVLRLCPRWVVFVEGVGAPSRPSQYFWGENLEGVRHSPVPMLIPNKIVYSPHLYAPSLRTASSAAAGELSFFDSPDFPRNLDSLFTKRWGFVFNR